MVSRRVPPANLPIELLVDDGSPSTGYETGWSNSLDRSDEGSPSRPPRSAAAKWCVAAIAATVMIGGVVWLRADRLSNPIAGAGSPPPPPKRSSTTIAAPSPTPAAQSALGPIGQAVTARPDSLSIELLGWSSIVLEADSGQTYRLDISTGALLPGAVVEPDTERRVPLWPGEVYLGDAADGTPVVRGEDGRAYAVDAGGRKALFAEGEVDLVEAGWFAETICDPTVACALRLHGAGDVVEFGNSSDSRVSFSPDGQFAAIWSGTGIKVLFVGPGAVAAGPSSTGSVVVPVHQLLVQTPSASTDARPITWRSDSGAFALIDDGELVLFDLAAGTAQRAVLPANVEISRVSGAL